MTLSGAVHNPLDDALLAARLFLIAPTQLGGLCLRGGGPAREQVLRALSDDNAILRRLPGHIDDERLLGGIDVAASLSAGRTVHQSGMLSDGADTVFVVPMAERIPISLAGKLSQACDNADMTTTPGLVLLDDGKNPDELPPAALLERVAFICDLVHAGHAGEKRPPFRRDNSTPKDVRPLKEDDLAALAGTAAALGVHSVRSLIFAANASRANAALDGRNTVSNDDLQVAVRLVLAPRATQIPQVAEEEPEAQPEPEASDRKKGGGNTNENTPLEDVLVEAALAAIPADLLAFLSDGKNRRQTRGSGTGRKHTSNLRGKPLGTRPGMPRSGARLALIDSLRAAVPWQPLRRRETGIQHTERPIIMRKEDLRVKRFEERSSRVTIFAVDASGSAAAARLAEAKGAVELMLAQTYVTRSEVALIAFRGDNAELLLPPTRSLTRARRALAELPGGGGTPLASGLHLARELATMVAVRGKTPSLVVLTDGRANIAADGSPGRGRAGEDADAAAQTIANEQIDTLVIDISARPGPESRRIADRMGARFLALPMADAKTLHTAISSIHSDAKAA